MSFLLPQTREARLEGVRAMELHGDRYLDLALRFEGEPDARVVRLHASECPADLAAGEPLSVRFVMGVATSVTRPSTPA